MPDSQPPRAMPPRDWSEAFAGLPDETPAGDGWARVARMLDAPMARSRRAWPRRYWPLGLAAAAVLAVVVVVPFGRVDTGSSPPAPAPASAPTLAAVTERATPIQATLGRDKEAGLPAVRSPPRSLESAAAGDTVFTRIPSRARKPVRAMVSSPSPAVPTGAPESTSLATPPPSPVAIADTVLDPVPQLQAESAQLEALVAFARDERVASASGAVLTGALDARLSLIDAALSQAGAGDGQQTLLWQQRVDTLRELAGVETTQRWLAARGERYDGALVRVD